MTIVTLEQELGALLNRHNAEADSDTPDFLLAGYLLACLQVWNTTVEAREAWYGRTLKKTPPLSELGDPPPG